MHTELHALLGICLWDVIGIAALVAAAVILVVHFVRKNRYLHSSR